MQPNLPNNPQSQATRVYSVEIHGRGKYRKIQQTALKIGFVVSVGSIGVLSSGQTDLAIAFEPDNAPDYVKSNQNSGEGENSRDSQEVSQEAKRRRIVNALRLNRANRNNKTVRTSQIPNLGQPQPQSAIRNSRQNNNLQNNNPLQTHLSSLRNERNPELINQIPITQITQIPITKNPQINHRQTVSIPVKNSAIANQPISTNQSRNQPISIPIPQVTTSPYYRGMEVKPSLPKSPNLPTLAAVDRYLPQPINENTAPPTTPGATNTSFIWPAQGVLTSGYGRRWGRMHQGIDIANKIGTPILAAATGVVEFAGRKRGYGNLIDIRHVDGSLTRYAHNHRHFVQVGQKVEQGEMIAHMGNTGFSTGPHLHFEIHPPGRGAVNPIAFLPPRI